MSNFGLPLKIIRLIERLKDQLEDGQSINKENVLFFKKMKVQRK